MANITLYAQPRARGPILNWSKLKQGIYDESTSMSGMGAMFFDVCASIWGVMKMRDPQPIISVIKANSMSDATWIIGIQTQGDKWSLRRDWYKGMSAENPENYFITISFEGNENNFSEVIRGAVRQLGYEPTGIGDWNKFTKKTGASQTDVIEKWRIYTASQPAVQPVQPASTGSGASCPNCHKSVGADFAMCPYCGSKLGKPTCPKCNKEIGSDFKMCPYCGTPKI